MARDKLTSLIDSAPYYQRLQEDEYLRDLYLGHESAFQHDAWYWDAIQKYKGTSYYETLAANPYLRLRTPGYSPTFWDNVGLEIFHDSSPWDNYFGKFRQEANKYLSDNLENIRQQEYDSAPSQAARERLAGINPDISGGQGITAGDAAENDQPSPAPFDMLHSEQTKQLVDFGLNFVTSVFSMSQGIQGLIGNAGQIAAQDISNHANAMNFIQDELVNTLSPDDLLSPDKLDDAPILLALDNMLKDTSFHSSTRRVLKRYRNEVFENSGKMNTLKTELSKRFLDSRKGVVDTMSSPYYSKELTDWLAKTGDYFTRLNAAVVREIDARESKAIYEDEKYSAVSGALEGSAMNEESIARRESAKRDATSSQNEESALEVYNELVKFLQEDDSIWSKFGLYFMPKLDNLLNTLAGGGFKIKFDSSDRSRHSTVNGGPTYKTGPTVINN